MENLELSDAEAETLTQELAGIIDSARYPLSPRAQTRRAILQKLRPEPVREPLLPPRRVYELHRKADTGDMVRRSPNMKLSISGSDMKILMRLAPVAFLALTLQQAANAAELGATPCKEWELASRTFYSGPGDKTYDFYEEANRWIIGRVLGSPR